MMTAKRQDDKRGEIPLLIKFTSDVVELSCRESSPVAVDAMLLYDN
jgi:hypothetical protein